MAKSTIGEVAETLRRADRIAVLSHGRPDGDTLGSNLGLSAALRRMGKTVSSLCEDGIPAKFCYMEGYDRFNERQSETFDTVVLVDCGDLLRVGANGELFRKCARTVNIDHHVSNVYYAAQNVVEDRASTCEIVLDLISELGVPLDTGIAACLYTGLSTDTGNFMHGNTDSRAFEAAARLARYIPDLSAVTTVLYKEMPKARLLLLARALPTVRFYLGDRLAVMSIRAEMMKETGADNSMTEGFVDYAVNVSGVEVGVCVMESGENCYKVSFRSKETDVCAVAERFGGGGHLCAAGCRINGFYEDVIEKVKREVSIAFEAEAEASR